MSTTIDMLTDVRQQTAMLRDVAELDCSHEELQFAAQQGDLVARQKLKLHTADGPVWYEIGQSLPQLDPAHLLLRPDRRLVTTRQRWEANQRYKQMSAQLDSTRMLQAQLRQANNAVDRAKVAVANAKATLAETMDDLKAAERKARAADDELAKALKVK